MKPMMISPLQMIMILLSMRSVHLQL